MGGKLLNVKGSPLSSSWRHRGTRRKRRSADIVLAVLVGEHCKQGNVSLFMNSFFYQWYLRRLADEVWSVIFADDIMICGESKEQVEESPRERRGMNVSRDTACVCVWVRATQAEWRIRMSGWVLMLGVKATGSSQERGEEESAGRMEGKWKVRSK